MIDRLQDVSNFYNSFFSSNKARFTSCPFISRHVILSFSNKQGVRYLDAGCGRGVLGNMLTRESNSHYTGIDISCVAISQGPESIDSTELICADIHDIPKPNNEYDVTLAIGVLEHCMDPIIAFGELVRVTKPGGLIFVSVPNPESFPRRFERKIGRKPVHRFIGNQPVSHRLSDEWFNHVIKKYNCKKSKLHGFDAITTLLVSALTILASPLLLSPLKYKILPFSKRLARKLLWPEYPHELEKWKSGFIGRSFSVKGKFIKICEYVGYEIVKDMVDDNI